MTGYVATGRQTALNSGLRITGPPSLRTNTIYVQALYAEAIALLNSVLLKEMEGYGTPTSIVKRADDLEMAAQVSRYIAVLLSEPGAEADGGAHTRRAVREAAVLALAGALDLIGRAAFLQNGAAAEREMQDPTPDAPSPPVAWRGTDGYSHVASPQSVLAHFGLDRSRHASNATSWYNRICLEVQRFESGAPSVDGSSGERRQLDKALHLLSMAPLSGPRAVVADRDPSLVSLQIARREPYLRLVVPGAEPATGDGATDGDENGASAATTTGSDGEKRDSVTAGGDAGMARADRIAARQVRREFASWSAFKRSSRRYHVRRQAPSGGAFFARTGIRTAAASVHV